MSIIEAYLAGPLDLRAAVEGLSREQLVSRPVPGKWSILEVVCHLADTDANIAHRIKRVLSEERPTFERVQPDLMQAALAYHAREAEEELTAFEITRRQIARILIASAPEAWSGQASWATAETGPSRRWSTAPSNIWRITGSSSSRSDSRWGSLADGRRYRLTATPRKLLLS